MGGERKVTRVGRGVWEGGEWLPEGPRVQGCGLEFRGRRRGGGGERTEMERAGGRLIPELRLGPAQSKYGGLSVVQESLRHLEMKSSFTKQWGLLALETD